MPTINNKTHKVQSSLKKDYMNLYRRIGNCVRAVGPSGTKNVRRAVATRIHATKMVWVLHIGPAHQGHQVHMQIQIHFLSSHNITII